MNASARQTLLMLALIFLAPLLLAWAVYRQPAWQPAGGLQHGELLPASGAITLAGREGGQLLVGHWTLLYRSPGPCGRHCRDLLDTLRRVRLAQGKGLGRVQRVLLSNHPAVVPPAPDLHVVADAHRPLAAGSVYLIDPHGRPVLRYRPGFVPMDLVSDLRHLLRVAGEA